MAVSDNVEIGKQWWPKWLLGLLIGAPITVGIGYYVYKRRGDSSTPTKNGTVKAPTEKPKPEDRPALPVPDLKEVVVETPLERAQKLRSSGNDLFKLKKHEDAIKCYTEAISICPLSEVDQLAMLYQNRAAAYDVLGNMEAVMDDCNKAIELNPIYMKALNRRYKAAERMGRLRNSLEDITAICILEKFENMDSLKHADRILKKYGNELARVSIAKKSPTMSSAQFIKAYISSFVNDPVFSRITQLNESSDAPLSGVKAALKALAEERYDDVIQCCNEQLAMEVASGEPHSEEYYEALLLRASMMILRSEMEAAIKEFTDIIDARPANVKVTVNALVKRAALYLQQEEAEKCTDDFATAISLDPTNADIYHHRGQVYLLSEKLDEALADFTKAVSESPEFGLAVVQQYYTVYREAAGKQDLIGADRATKDLLAATRRFSDTFQGYLFLAQVYSDQKNFEEADRALDQALKHDPSNATILVHKGMLELQWHSNVEKAVEYFEHAIKADKKCEYAYETLASIEVQRGNLVRAVDLFDKALELAKNEKELAHLCALKAAAEAQQVVARRLNIPNGVMGVNF